MNNTLKALLRRDYLSFARKAIFEVEGARIGDEPYLDYLAGALAAFADDKTRRLVINLPPGHLKTLLGSVCLSAWMLAHNPSLKIIVVTHAEHLSNAIARRIRSILQSEWYKEIFATRIKKGHAEVTDFGTSTGGGVFSGSFHGGITGRRADAIIVDDPHDIADTPEQIEDAIEFFDTVLLSRLNHRKQGRILVVAHRVHERDLSAALLRKKKWQHIVLPLVATRKQTYQTASGKWTRRTGEVLRPEAFGPDDIDELREGCFNPHFEMLYQQDHDGATLPPIRADHFRTITKPMPHPAPIVLSVDAGVTKRWNSAFSVIQAWRVGANRYYLIDQFREQCEYSYLLDAIRRFRRKYRPVAVLIERAANGHALISDLIRKYPKLGDLVIPVDCDGRSKSARLRVHAETIIAKRIYLPADELWRDAFVSEFVEFPHGKFTDQVDATTQFLDHAQEFVGMKPRPQAGAAVLSLNSTGRSVVGQLTDSQQTGLLAGVHSNGRRINVAPESSRGGTSTMFSPTGEAGMAVGTLSNGRSIKWTRR
jgi:predicted phage terminase large subunit-like protein